MGTATARVLSAVYPPWMAIVSSCMRPVAPLGDSSQPVLVQADGHASPRPGGPGPSLVEPEGLDERRVSFTAGHPLVEVRQTCVVLGTHAVNGQPGHLVALVPHVATRVPLVLAQEAGPPVLGVTLHHQHPAAI